MSGDEERLAELDERAEALKRRRTALDAEVERWKRERDRLNESARGLRAAAVKHREERDRANEGVSEIKRGMEALRRELYERRGRLAEIDAELGEGRRRLQPRRDVEERLRRIEWEMMTTPTAEMMEREEALVEKAGELRRSLDAHKELDGREDERLRVLADIKATELAIRGCRDEITRLHEASEANHEEMILLYGKVDEERGRADDAHARFLERLSAVRAVDDELREVVGEARRLRGRLRESERLEAAERDRETERRKEELLTEARRKLDAGERLSLDELRLLYGEEEDEKA